MSGIVLGPFTCIISWDLLHNSAVVLLGISLLHKEKLGFRKATRSHLTVDMK